MNEKVAQKDKELVFYGDEPGDFIGDTRAVYDTAFFSCATALTDKQLFQRGGDTHEDYKNGSFPTDEYARRIIGISVETDLVFNGTALTNPNNYARFIKHSKIVLNRGKRQVGEYLLCDLLGININTNPAAIATTVQKIFNNIDSKYIFKLKRPLRVGKGKELTVKFIPADSLTTAAYDATATPVYPNSGMTNSGSGYALTVRFYVDEYEVNT